MKRSYFAALVALTMSVGVLAQSAEQELIKVNDALAEAARDGGKAAYGKLLGDDLRWINAIGVLHNKTQRSAQLGGAGGGPRRFREREVKIYGDTAVLTEVAEFADRSQRGHRVFVKRGGQWQLVSHSATRIDPNAK